PYLQKMREACEKIREYVGNTTEAALKALRNRIDHNYASVDAGMIWKFATEEIENIETNLTRILKKRFGV
ncbi:MAG: HepT-like ribonuclease domain-containing protein, partial [Bdellovibrionota bacterium]